jgi:hypothetical protein
MYYDVGEYNTTTDPNPSVKSYNGILCDINNNTLGNLHMIKQYNNSPVSPIYATIITPKGTIMYNYVSMDKKPIITKSIYSSGKYRHVTIKREYISITKRKITIKYRQD